MQSTQLQSITLTDVGGATTSALYRLVTDGMGVVNGMEVQVTQVADLDHFINPIVTCASPPDTLGQTLNTVETRTFSCTAPSTFSGAFINISGPHPTGNCVQPATCRCLD